jgi:hypothetical protein
MATASPDRVGLVREGRCLALHFRLRVPGRAPERTNYLIGQHE